VVPSDDSLYERMLTTLVGSWTRIAEGTPRAEVVQVGGGVVAVFPAGPERLFYNNAVLTRGLDAEQVRHVAAEIVARYQAAGVDRYAVWAHESDEAGNADMTDRGFHVDITTRAMAMSLDEIAVPFPDIEMGPSDWDEYLRVTEIPEGTLAGVDRGAFHVLVARVHGENVAAGMAYDHEGDCGVFNLGTLNYARRRGVGTALTALHLYRARERGCTTASLQSTKEAQGVYSAVGFRDLGRFIEYVP
jgi:ribosomal protein S18 acetylase RimI-like enzyme